jgi:hypothetical protein
MMIRRSLTLPESARSERESISIGNFPVGFTLVSRILPPMAANEDPSAAKQRRQKGSLLVLLLALGGTLAALCHQAFLPHEVSWANDVPLAAMMDPSSRLPGTFAGHWDTLYYIGGAGPSSSPSFSTMLQWILQPVMYLKIYAPLTMLILGFGAWLFFRGLGFAPAVCAIGGLGAGLNMHFFSNACWGLGNWNVSAAMVFMVLAILASSTVRPSWVKAALAGLAVGMIVMEGFDVGAILSLYVGIFIVFYFVRTAPDPVQGIRRTIGMGTIVVLFALLISDSTLYTLVGTQIKGTTAAAQTPEEKEGRWNFTTQWSFPKLETVRLIIPGLFGYRLQDYITDTNRASAYWGKIAEDPHIDALESSDPQTRAHAAASLGLQPDIQNVMASDNLRARDQILDQIKAGLQRRHTGSGDYTGVLVCLLAVFALFNTWRLDSPYSKEERQFVWFWGIAALISLLAAWGRYSWLYRFIYELGFMGDIPTSSKVLHLILKGLFYLPNALSNFRNPIKYLHPLNICLMILSGYGLEALYRGYMRAAVTRTGAWWAKAAAFDKKWTIATLVVFGASVLGLLILASSKDDLTTYLAHSGFSTDVAPQMAAFCIREVLFFIFFFGASVAVLVSILAGAWSGRRATWAWVILGAIMILDLSRSDAPWVRYYDYTQKYSMNPVVALLRQQPWEHRVMSRFSPTGGYIPGDGNLGLLCHWWLENDYLYNNIESLELDQAPRLPDLDKNYINNFAGWSSQDLSPPVRMWRLTNTRYIFADARVTPALNQLAEPRNSFRNVMLVDIVAKPGIDQPEDAGDLTVVTNEHGHDALIEFTAALPRAKLYSDWQMADDVSTLARLNSVAFDPANTVLIATNTPLAEKPAQPGADPGTVAITTYEPKHVVLRADAKTPAVMLLNDHTGEYWSAWVDQKPAAILRCNYIMRGIYLTPGQHTIEFRFRAPMQWLYVSASAFAFGVLLTAYVALTSLRRPPPA